MQHLLTFPLPNHDQGPWTVETGSWSKKAFLVGVRAPPKRPQSAFFAWSNKKRANLKKKLPNATNSEISKLLAKKWKELAPEAKVKYQENESQLRKKYKEEMATWKAMVNSPIQERRDKAMKMAEFERNSSISSSREGLANGGNVNFRPFRTSNSGGETATATSTYQISRVQKSISSPPKVTVEIPLSIMPDLNHFTQAYQSYLSKPYRPTNGPQTSFGIPWYGIQGGQQCSFSEMMRNN